MTKADILKELSNNPATVEFLHSFLDLEESDPETAKEIIEKVKTGTPIVKAVQEV